MAFKKATKQQQKLRLAISGPAGSGKTFTALTFARLLGGRIAVIDTERDSASLYAGEVADFDVNALGIFSPDAYLKAIAEARAAKYEVLIVDSFSHAWAGRGGILEMKDEMAGDDRKKNFTVWAKLTPLHQKLIDAILTFPGHVIATMRSKQAYQIATEFVDGKTKNVVQKLGMEPVQRDDIPYEFTVMFDMDETNTASVVKTRCRALRGKTFREPGQEVIDILQTWLNSGAPADIEPRPLASTAPRPDATPAAAPTASTHAPTAPAPTTAATASTPSAPSMTSSQPTPSTQDTPATTETAEAPRTLRDHMVEIDAMAKTVVSLETREDLLTWAKSMRELPAKKRGDKTAAWTAFQARCAELNLSARELLDEAEGRAA